MAEPLYADLLAEVAARCREFDQQLQPPAIPRDINSLRERARSELGVDVPDEYVAFLRLHDGLDWNGLVIYASHTTPIADDARYSIQGLVEANLAWREAEPHKDFLFFGESGVDIYCLHVSRREYQITDRQSGRLSDVVPSFEHLIVEAFKAHRLAKA